MKEIRNIVKAFAEAQSEGIRSALCTVVHVEGSSYRSPGARMLITEHGNITGAISGGCLEGDALKKAQSVMLSGTPRLIRYDNTDEDDMSIGMQLGCNGAVSILFEPLTNDESAANVMALLRTAAASRGKAMLVTVASPTDAAQTRTCGVITAQGSKWLTDDDNLKNKALQHFETASPASETTDCGIRLFQFIPPTVRLLIAGAGNDVQPLVTFAAIAGYYITVVDGRPAYASKTRFPSADEVSIVKANNIESYSDIGENTVAVLMSHNYNYDLAWLKKLLSNDCRYIGMLGPTKKYERMKVDLEKDNIMISAADSEKIFAPVGLDLGAETSEEIALSIAAEIAAVLTGRKGASLKYRAGAIHTSVC